MSGGLAIAVLAAGRGARFGGAKLDADLEGKAVGLHAVTAANGVPAAYRALVVGPIPPRFAAMADGFERVTNPLAEQGMGTSIASAARWARERQAGALLLLLADMPQLSAATLTALGAAVERGRPSAVRYPSGAGIPACFPADWFAALADLAGDSGAKSLLRTHEVALIDVAPGELIDIDHPQDLGA